MRLSLPAMNHTMPIVSGASRAILASRSSFLQRRAKESIGTFFACLLFSQKLIERCAVSSMGCHNDRVARTRKHAESKRTKSIRRTNKDRDREIERERERQPSFTAYSPSRSRSVGSPLHQNTYNQQFQHQDTMSTFSTASPSMLSTNVDLGSTITGDVSGADISPLASSSSHKPGKDGENKEHALSPPHPPTSLKALRASEKKKNSGLTADRNDMLRANIGQTEAGTNYFGADAIRSRNNAAQLNSTSSLYKSTLTTIPPSSMYLESENDVQPLSHSLPTNRFRKSSNAGPPPPLLVKQASFDFQQQTTTASAASSGLSISRSISPSSVFSARSSPHEELRSLSPGRRPSTSPTIGTFAHSQSQMLAQSVPPRSSSVENNRYSSLTAPTSNKGVNRRSGFYGVMSIAAPLSPPINGSMNDMIRSGSRGTHTATPSPISGGEGEAREDYFIVPRSLSSESSNGQRDEEELETDSTGPVQPLTIDRLQTPSLSKSTSPFTPSFGPLTSSTSAMHNSASFYDPDLLVFLDAVNDPNSLKRSSTALLPLQLSSITAPLEGTPSRSDTSSSYSGTDVKPPTKLGIITNKQSTITANSHSPKVAFGSTESEEEEEKEHLSPLSRSMRDSRVTGLGLSTSSAGRRSLKIEEEDAEDNEKAINAVNKVRESIRRSRGGSLSNESGSKSSSGSVYSNGMTLDVELVELLISELEQTKNKMKELQKNYNAIRVRILHDSFGI